MTRVNLAVFTNYVGDVVVDVVVDVKARFHSPQ